MVDRMALQETKRKNRDGHILYVVAILFVVAVVAIFLDLTFQSNGAKPQTTSVPYKNASFPESFLSAYEPPRLPPGIYTTVTSNFNVSNGACSYTEYVKVFDQYGLPFASPPPISFDSFDKSIPILYYI